ncbi:MAG TPA: MBOAT family protein [Firmicutes bacterium]|nr:MBOAT family protein [Bacillota bacterium]
MVFSSLFFLFIFLPLTLLLYYLVPQRCKNLILFISSLVFYAWGEPVYILLMFFSVTINHALGLLIGKSRKNRKTARRALIFSVIINVGLLGFFKYSGFLLQILGSVVGASLQNPGLPLPIGISFYTFQALSYIIDIYRGRISPQQNFIAFGTYISLFPQLIAGPIVRYQTIAGQLLRRPIEFNIFGEGVRRFAAGLGKKVLLANNVGLLWEQIRELPPEGLPIITAWLGIAAFALQIYFDFSGYSDMAVGLGKMFGFTFPENFRHPYISRSITEFWRRWHITLGTWFREYVYIPLGGNRTGRQTHLRNIFIVWFLTGLWHGAAWNFALWGLYNGLILVLEKYCLLKWLGRAPRFLSHAYAIVTILLGWVLFSFDNMATGSSYLGAMFGLSGGGIFNLQAIYYCYTHAILIAIAIFASTPIYGTIKQKLQKKSGALYYVATTLSSLLLLFLSTAYLVDAAYNPFLYFRF